MFTTGPASYSTSDTLEKNERLGGNEDIPFDVLRFEPDPQEENQSNYFVNDHRLALENQVQEILRFISGNDYMWRTFISNLTLNAENTVKSFLLNYLANIRQRNQNFSGTPRREGQTIPTQVIPQKEPEKIPIKVDPKKEVDEKTQPKVDTQDILAEILANTNSEEERMDLIVKLVAEKKMSPNQQLVFSLESLFGSLENITENQDEDKFTYGNCSGKLSDCFKVLVANTKLGFISERFSFYQIVTLEDNKLYSFNEDQYLSDMYNDDDPETGRNYRECLNQLFTYQVLSRLYHLATNEPLKYILLQVEDKLNQLYIKYNKSLYKWAEFMINEKSKDKKSITERTFSNLAKPLSDCLDIGNKNIFSEFDKKKLQEEIKAAMTLLFSQAPSRNDIAGKKEELEKENAKKFCKTPAQTELLTEEINSLKNLIISTIINTVKQFINNKKSNSITEAESNIKESIVNFYNDASFNLIRAAKEKNIDVLRFVLKELNKKLDKNKLVELKEYKSKVKVIDPKSNKNIYVPYKIKIFDEDEKKFIIRIDNLDSRIQSLLKLFVTMYNSGIREIILPPFDALKNFINTQKIIKKKQEMLEEATRKEEEEKARKAKEEKLNKIQEILNEAQEEYIDLTTGDPITDPTEIKKLEQQIFKDRAAVAAEKRLKDQEERIRREEEERIREEESKTSVIKPLLKNIEKAFRPSQESTKFTDEEKLNKKIQIIQHFEDMLNNLKNSKIDKDSSETIGSLPIDFFNQMDKIAGKNQNRCLTKQSYCYDCKNNNISCEEKKEMILKFLNQKKSELEKEKEALKKEQSRLQKPFEESKEQETFKDENIEIIIEKEIISSKEMELQKIIQAKQQKEKEDFQDLSLNGEIE